MISSVSNSFLQVKSVFKMFYNFIKRFLNLWHRCWVMQPLHVDGWVLFFLLFYSKSFPKICQWSDLFSFSESPLFDKCPLQSCKIILRVDGLFVFIDCLIHSPLMKSLNINTLCAVLQWRYWKLLISSIKDLISNFWQLLNLRPLLTVELRKSTDVWDIPNVN